jgi:hypothetical protein
MDATIEWNVPAKVQPWLGILKDFAEFSRILPAAPVILHAEPHRDSVNRCHCRAGRDETGERLFLRL